MLRLRRAFLSTAFHPQTDSMRPVLAEIITEFDNPENLTG
jgi:hypothetical protein